MADSMKDFAHSEEIKTRFPNVTEDGTRYTNLLVLSTPAGYYLGRYCWTFEDFGNGVEWYEEPYSRETDYMTRVRAEKELASGEYDVRDCAENNHAYATGALPSPKGEV